MWGRAKLQGTGAHEPVAGGGRAGRAPKGFGGRRLGHGALWHTNTWGGTQGQPYLQIVPSPGQLMAGLWPA